MFRRLFMQAAISTLLVALLFGCAGTGFAQLGLSLEQFKKNLPQGAERLEGEGEYWRVPFAVGGSNEVRGGGVWGIEGQGVFRDPKRLEFVPREHPATLHFADNRLQSISLQSGEEMLWTSDVEAFLKLAAGKSRWKPAAWQNDIFPLVAKAEPRTTGGAKYVEKARLSLQVIEISSAGSRVVSETPLRSWGYHTYTTPQTYLVTSGTATIVLERSDGQAVATYGLTKSEYASKPYPTSAHVSEPSTYWQGTLKSIVSALEGDPTSLSGYNAELRQRVGNDDAFRALNIFRLRSAIGLSIGTTNVPPAAISDAIVAFKKLPDGSAEVLLPDLHAKLVARNASLAQRERIVAVLAEIKDPSSASPLIRFLAGDALVANASDKNAAAIASLRSEAFATLEATTGEAFGEDVARWQRWLAEHEAEK